MVFLVLALRSHFWCSYALCSRLPYRPLQWDGAYIPLVPPAHEHLLGFIENTPPVPFFMGISLDGWYCLLAVKCAVCFLTVASVNTIVIMRDDDCPFVGGLVLPEPNRQDDCVRLNLETNAVTPEVLPAEWAMLPPQLFVYLLDATTECADALSEAGSAPDASSPSRSHNDTHAGGNGFKRALAIHKFRIAYAAVVISLLAGYDKFIYRGGVRMASPAARARAAAAKPNESSAESSSATELGRNSESMSFDTEAFLQYKRDIYAADDGAVQFMTVCAIVCNLAHALLYCLAAIIQCRNVNLHINTGGDGHANVWIFYHKR